MTGEYFSIEDPRDLDGEPDTESIVVRLSAEQVKTLCIEAAEFDIHNAIMLGIETGHELTGHCLLFADGRAEIKFEEDK
jgi:hypothetical protein